MMKNNKVKKIMEVLQVAQLGNNILRCQAKPVNNIWHKNLQQIIKFSPNDKLRQQQQQPIWKLSNNCKETQLCAFLKLDTRHSTFDRLEVLMT